MAITAQSLTESFNKTPLPQKLAGLALTALVVTGLNYYLLTSDKYAQIAQREVQLEQANTDLIAKQTIADNLAQFKHEKDMLERKLSQALTELPNEANMEDLIRTLSEIGTKSGLTILAIEPQGEVKQSFYASIPIAMSVVGNYHEIAVFLDSLSKIARIVNVTNISMSDVQIVNHKVQVKASYLATTFRFLPEAGK